MRAQSDLMAATGEPGGSSPGNRGALQYAMLSVYYDSLGRKLSSHGAPAILLPLQVQPLSLGDALGEIQLEWPDHLRDAVWRVVSSVPAPRKGAKRSRYPAALGEVLARHDAQLSLKKLDRLRRKYGAGANLFAAALVARAEGRKREFRVLRDAMRASEPSLSRAAERALGMSASDFLTRLDDRRTARRVRKLRHEVGLSLYEFVGEFADAMAFDAWWPPTSQGAMTVYPATCAIRQDVSTLITRITVSALVHCEDFFTIARSVDPQCWAMSSDVVTGSRYVLGSYDLRPAVPTRPGQGLDPPQVRMLEENVTVPWGFGDDGVGSFRNVLRIDKFAVEPKRETITLNFSLARSINSRIFWDERAGGILVDQGFIKVRPIATDRWRVTSHKTLLFSNRTPNATGTGWVEFGQMLNFLAPAALSWWLESELYSGADHVYSNPHQVQARLDRYRNGSSDGRSA